MLTGVELTLMGLMQSNSGLFTALGFIVSSVGKGERRKRKGEGKEGKREYKRNGRREERKEEGIKKDWRKDKKKEF